MRHKPIYENNGAPTVNDDASNGYKVSDGWLDTSVTPNVEYTCVDNTTGAAVWTNISDSNTALSQLNEGQVKILTGNSVKPQLVWALPTVNTFIQVTYASPLGFAASPVTQFPENIASPVDADIYDFTNDTFIENTVLGQVNIWRVICDFSGKTGAIQTGINAKMENPISGFTIEKVVDIPAERTTGTIEIDFITIADGNSLPAPLGIGQGYELYLAADDPITIDIDSITRINYQKNVR